MKFLENTISITGEKTQAILKILKNQKTEKSFSIFHNHIILLFVIMSMIDTDSRIELMVCTPHQPVRVISARLSGQISALQSLWPENPKRFIYNGNQLLEGMTFHFYGIRDGDSIIALPKDTISDLHCSQWLCLSRDSDNFNEYMKWMLDPRTSGEAARLRDLHLWKIEKRPRIYMKMKGPFYSSDSNENEKSKNSLNVDFLPLNEPAEQALPILW
ncbi:hypothetical protein TRFO_23727 [Tritrichomonas foetus]|uniref:Ubiquitin-like domain-containing protein n=1 Tax=Tritrichomonas foetus TaxID=1144522 RepID=A0A1J4KE15_9EUKA|nr:hypothetical protein TRFO_23727 [Tritrichomonas foetus]|eukprot:OHT07870.1 hypothetical protein TRFO_23727 [Tritrichomonas foetus]